MNRWMALLGCVVVLSWGGVAAAQCCGGCATETVAYAEPVATTAYYAPTTAYYAPTTAYYAPTSAYYAPTTAYYAPTTAYYAPTTAYYAPTTAYYSPAAVVAPGPIVQTRYRPILGGTVTRVYNPPYMQAYPSVAYYRY
jgi:hypothetical protein